VPRPNYVLETSPEKYQVVWKVEGLAQDEAEALQRAMVREFGGDPAATDSTRVLRLPEFVNRKCETEHVVRAQPGATQTYHLQDFRLRTDLHEAPAQYRPHEARSAPAGDLTQSERDWAFAKRALSRGDDPEEIIRRIADYRREEKHPSYARYTVEKAQATLQRKFGEMSSAGGETTQAIEPGRDTIEIP
jgi:RepB DNA-primase from phage plasmid